MHEGQQCLLQGEHHHHHSLLVQQFTEVFFGDTPFWMLTNEGPPYFNVEMFKALYIGHIKWLTHVRVGTAFQRLTRMLYQAHLGPCNMMNGRQLLAGSFLAVCI